MMFARMIGAACAAALLLPAVAHAAPIYRCRPATPQTLKLTEQNTNCKVARATERFVYSHDVLSSGFNANGGCPRYGDLDLPNTWSLAGFCWFAAGKTVSGNAQIHSTGVNLAGTRLADVWVTQPRPVLIAGPYHGRRPTTIDISGDAGDIVTGLHWSSWTGSYANGEGTSNIQGCVPDCASGTETPVPTSIKLMNPKNGYFTKLVEQRDGRTEVFVYTPGHLPDNWPGDAS